MPVSAYGFEVFSWSQGEVELLMKHHIQGWRQLLQIGRRAPVDITACLAGLHSCSIDWRAQRVALLVRLANSPQDSLQHHALIVMRELQTSWYTEALQDIRLIFPSLSVWVQEPPRFAILLNVFLV